MWEREFRGEESEGGEKERKKKKGEREREREREKKKVSGFVKSDYILLSVFWNKISFLRILTRVFDI